MIYLWCTRPSNGARDLVRKINELAEERIARRLRRALVVDHGHLVVGWGESTPTRHPPILNAVHVGSKLRELTVLAREGIPIPQATTTPTPNWYARTFRHRSADDLLANLERGDYYVEPVETVAELRVHVFRGVAFRVAKKEPGPNAHPHFRTHSAGWRLVYGRSHTDIPGRDEAVEVAKRGVAALGYDFGAVDVGVRNIGEPVVFEVNAAPGLEGNTLTRYAEKILAYYREPGRLAREEE